MKKLLLAAIVCLSLRSFAAVPPPEKLLPDDTLVFLTVPDFTKARETYNNSPQGQLWGDPSLKAFKDKFLDKLKSEYITPLERELGVHFEDYSGLPQGQLTVALTQNGWNPADSKSQEPGLLLLLDTRDKTGQLKTNLADLKKKWVDAGKTVRTEKLRDVEFSVITLSSNDVPKVLRKASADADKKDSDSKELSDDSGSKKSAGKQNLFIGQADSVLIMGDAPKSIEKILARLSGSEVKTVSEVPTYESTHAALFRDAVAFGWVNTKVFVDMLMHMDTGSDDTDSAKNPFGFKPAQIISAVGLGGLKSLALSYRISDEGAQGTFFLGVPESGRAGIFKILAGEGKDCNPPPFVPADAVKFQRWRIDGQKAWAAIQKIVNDVNPQALNGLNFLLSTAETAAKEKNPDFDIKKNLFGNLGDDVIVYSKSPKGEHLAELNSGPSLIMIGSPNAEQLVGAIRSVLPLFGQSASAPAEREFLGRKVYSLPLPALPTAKGGAGESHNLNYAFSGGYLVISTDNGILEEYLRSSQNEGKALRDTPGLREATHVVAGNGTSIFSYSNDSESMRATISALKKDFDSVLNDSNLGPAVAAMGIGSPDKIKEWFDVSLLPDYDRIAKYFSFTVFAETATPEGLVFKGFTPTPSALKKQAAGH